MVAMRPRDETNLQLLGDCDDPAFPNLHEIQPKFQKSQRTGLNCCFALRTRARGQLHDIASFPQANTRVLLKIGRDSISPHIIIDPLHAALPEKVQLNSEDNDQ